MTAGRNPLGVHVRLPLEPFQFLFEFGNLIGLFLVLPEEQFETFLVERYIFFCFDDATITFKNYLDMGKIIVFEVFFTVDGTATYNEKFHLSALANLAHGFAAPVLVQELLEIG